MTNLPELLAPVGEYSALEAALDAGADAVYLGSDRMNLRSKTCHAFTLDELPGVAAACTRKGARAYLTLNTTLFDGELSSARELIAAAKGAGISAVILSDPAVLMLCRELGMEAHLSTQVSVSNLEAARFYSQWADRIVLARELDLDKITAIVRGIEADGIKGPSGRPLEIEVFAHGALCVAVSGRCYMSLYMYNHSANRGECIQPCRRSYRVTDEETGLEAILERNHVMSPSDLCTLPFLDKVVATGARVLKIEGRTRSPEYVSIVTGAYRRALDAIGQGSFSASLAAELEAELKKVYNRGFSEGFYLGLDGAGREELWAGKFGSKATHRKVYSAKVVNYYAKPAVAELLVESAELRAGDELLIIGPTSGVVRFTPEELRLDAESVTRAGKQQRITVKVPAVVRENDRVYLFLTEDEASKR